MIAVRRSIHIAAPPAAVAAQFGDVEHHARSDVHQGVRFCVIHDDRTNCEYEQTTAVGPFRSRQRMVLDRSDPSRHEHRIVAGLLRGGTITFAFAPEAGGTRVTATLRAEPRGPYRPVAPLLARAAARSFERALAEDRADVESGAHAS